MLKRSLKVLSSLRLTVALLALGIVLVFFGTLGQVSDGLYEAQARYFRSWWTTWHPVGSPWLRVPMPGGYLLGTLLVLNLLAAHAARFQFSWKKSGILLAHLGILLLLLGQLATDMLSRESQMSFREGESRNYSEDFHKHELVFARPGSQPDTERIVSIPASQLAPGAEVRHPELPFTVRVKAFHENADVRRFAPMVDTNRSPASTAGMGARLVLEPLPPDRSMDGKSMPAAVLELEEGGTSRGTWLTSALLRSDSVDVGGTAWRVELRPVRYYEPFQLTLLKTTHEVYPGTDLPRNFQSRVRIENPSRGEEREVDIYMNNPLRYGGLTFYQYQMGREQLERGGRGTSALQVVRNPSWLTPYLGCILVGVGLLVQFLLHLVGFLTRRRSPSTPVPAAA